MKKKIICFALDDKGRPITIKDQPDIDGAPAVQVDEYRPKLTREEAEKELARLQRIDPKKAREYFLKHKRLLTGGTW